MKDAAQWSHKNDFKQEEVWNTNTVLAGLICPRLVAFRDCDLHSYPDDGSVQDMRHWKQLLQKMIDAFEMLKHDSPHSDEDDARIQEGLNLFARYFKYLWD